MKYNHNMDSYDMATNSSKIHVVSKIPIVTPRACIAQHLWLSQGAI